MQIKTTDLIGPALDWAVAKARNEEYRYMASTGGDYNGSWWWATRNYSTEGSEVIEIMEREGIDIKLIDNSPPPIWSAQLSDPFGAKRRAGISLRACIGPTPRIAVLRCFVASRLGDEVEVPEELLS